MQPEFEILANRMGLADAERNLAEIVWKQCEKTMTGKGGQTAVLFGGEVVNFETRNTVILHNIETLTDKEIDFMVHMNRGALTALEEIKKLINHSIQQEWVQCDPENPYTIDCFEALNEYKDLKRKVKRQSNTLAGIQRKLKKAKGSL
mgnify:CR=1 FL=1